MNCLTKNGLLKHFLTSFDAILKDISAAKIIVWYLTISLKTTILQCFKNYGSPARVTRLKVAPKMADPISINAQTVAIMVKRIPKHLTFRPIVVSLLFSFLSQACRKSCLYEHILTECGCGYSHYRYNDSVPPCLNNVDAANPLMCE